MAGNLTQDPYAAVRTLQLAKNQDLVLPGGTNENGEAYGEQVHEGGWEPALPDGWHNQQLKDAGFETKYGSFTAVDPVNLPGLYKAVMQQPGAHKYDTQDVFYKLDETTGIATMVGDPVPTRQISSAEKFKDATERGLTKVGQFAAAVAAIYGGAALYEAYTAGSLGSGALAETVGAEALGEAGGYGYTANLAEGATLLGDAGAAAATTTGGNLLNTAAGKVVDLAKTAGAEIMDWGIKDYVDLAKIGLTAYGMYDMATNDGPDMTVPNQLVNDQIQLGRDALQFNKEMYADAKERQVGIDEVNKNAITTSTNLSREAGNRAADSWDFYLKEGRPMVQSTFSDAANWDSKGALDQAAGEAKSTVEQNFGNIKQQNFRTLSRMGINPNSGRFASLNNQIAMQKALAASGAMTGAMDDRKTQAVGMRQQASNLAQGFPAQSMNFGAQGMAGANSAANVAGVSGAQNNAIGANAMSGMGMGANIFGNAANQASSNATTAYGAQSANQQGWGNLMGYMWGGKFADGGKVQGPGTGTSDSVPAVNTDNGQRVQLSNGEFVIPADVVRALGTKHFEGLIAKHHKPVNIGRQA